MKCIKCGNKMRLDDCDKFSYGKYDNYFVCDEDNITCIEQVRCGMSVNDIWLDEDGNDINAKIMR